MPRRAGYVASHCALALAEAGHEGRSSTIWLAGIVNSSVGETSTKEVTFATRTLSPPLFAGAPVDAVKHFAALT
jgi:hypothetical protein